MEGVVRKINTRRVGNWQINSSNSPVILLSWISRCIRVLILIRFLGKLLEKLFLPNARNLVNEGKFVGSSLENSFEEISMTLSSRELKSVKVFPENLLADKSNKRRENMLEMDSGTFPEKLFLANIRI